MSGHLNYSNTITGKKFEGEAPEIQKDHINNIPHNLMRNNCSKQNKY